MKQALIYGTKVWLTIIVTAPIVGGAILYGRFTNQMFKPWTQVFEVPEIGIPFGFLYFILPWIIFSLVSDYLNGKFTDRSRKISLSIIAVILSIIPFAIDDYHSVFKDDTGLLAGFPPNLMWTCTSAVIAFAMAWFYQLKPKIRG